MQQTYVKIEARYSLRVKVMDVNLLGTGGVSPKFELGTPIALSPPKVGDNTDRVGYVSLFPTGHVSPMRLTVRLQST